MNGDFLLLCQLLPQGFEILPGASIPSTLLYTWVVKIETWDSLHGNISQEKLLYYD